MLDRVRQQVSQHAFDSPRVKLCLDGSVRNNNLERGALAVGQRLNVCQRKANDTVQVLDFKVTDDRLCVESRNLEQIGE